MILTRYKILKSQLKVKKYLDKQKSLKNRSIIYKCAKKYLRGKVQINYRENLLRIEKLNNDYNIDKINKMTSKIFISTTNSHWAETDGETIWLNYEKEYDMNTLFYTILHEEFHGIIFRNFRNNKENKNNKDNFNLQELSEYIEHKIMYKINKSLISND